MKWLIGLVRLRHQYNSNTTSPVQQFVCTTITIYQIHIAIRKLLSSCSFKRSCAETTDLTLEHTTF